MRVNPATCLWNLAFSVLPVTSNAEPPTIQGYTKYVNFVQETATEG
jgi:hypothetical protein